jgi:hypothetical protein
MGSDPGLDTGTAGGLPFLTQDASAEVLLEAIAANHIDWMNRLARASGGTAAAEDGVNWTCVSRADTQVTAAVTQPPGPSVRDQLDRMLSFCRREKVDRVGYWAFLAAYADPLGAWLGARGFRLGGRPHWMSYDLYGLPDLPPIAELAAETGAAVTDRFTPYEDADLPCYHPDTAWVRERMAAERPQRVWHAIQWQDGNPVGQVSLCVTTGGLGVCGLHDMVVVPGSRVAGMGIARFHWICRFALDLGSRYLITNAAQDAAHLYRMAGLRSLGLGQTWWLPGHALHNELPPVTVAFAEAVGLGQLDALESLAREPGSPGLNEALPNQMTPLQFAGAAGRQDSARWLLARGAQPEVTALWDLGWKAETRELLESRPQLVSQPRPRSGKTLMHVAVERDDLELAQLLLSLGIDLSVTENQFGGTALDWARQLQRARIAAAIKRAERAR